jgi:hypothetical protein
MTTMLESASVRASRHGQELDWASMIKDQRNISESSSAGTEVVEVEADDSGAEDGDPEVAVAQAQ